MTPQQKANITRRATALAPTLCDKYVAAGKSGKCQGCSLQDAVFDHDYKAMQAAITKYGNAKK